jgi:hypothetical protein
MFSSTMKLSFEGSPIEILRRYAPYIIGAMAAVGIVASIYYVAFASSKDMTVDTASSATTTIQDSSTIVSTLLNKTAATIP